MTWTRPDGVTEALGDTYYNAKHNGGLFPVRISDSESAVRFLMCYKAADSKGLVLAYPLPATVFPPTYPAGSHWPKTLTAGALIEEYASPTDDDAYAIKNWGTGWTRRPGFTSTAAVPSQTTILSGIASDY